MTRKDHPEFRSKAQREQDNDLEAKYRELGNPELVAAIKQQKKPMQATQVQHSAHKRERD